MLRSLVAPLVAAGSLQFGSLACSSDDQSAYSPYGPVWPYDAGTAGISVGGTPGYDGGTGADAGTPPGKDDRLTAPLSPRVTPCLPLEIAPAAEPTPISSLRSLTLTQTRVYLGRSDGIAGFERLGGCAGTRVTTLVGPETSRGPVVALAAGVSDTVLVGRPDGLVLLSPEGALLSKCDQRSVTGLATLVDGDRGQGVAVLGSRELVRLEFDAEGCSASPSPLNLPVEAVTVLGVSVDLRSPESWVVALQKTRAAAPTLVRAASFTGEIPGSCSVTGISAAAPSVATLDAACAAVRFFDMDVRRETYRSAIPAPLVGRALATVPDHQGTEITLGAVSVLDGRPSLWVLSTTLPNRQDGG